MSMKTTINLDENYTIKDLIRLTDEVDIIKKKETLERNNDFLRVIKQDIMKNAALNGRYYALISNKMFHDTDQRTWIADKLKTEGYEVRNNRGENNIMISWKKTMDASFSL